MRVPSSTVLTFVLLVEACSPAASRGVVAATLEPDDVRHAFLEGTLRVLDDHPEYVDELFVLNRRHPRTMSRFLENAARASRDEDFARFTAERLVRDPEGLRQIMVSTLEAARDQPAARAAISRAIEQRNTLATNVIADRPSAVVGSLNAMVQVVQRRPRARRAFLHAMRGNSDELARLLASDPDTLAAMASAMAAYLGSSFVDALRQSDLSDL